MISSGTTPITCKVKTLLSAPQAKLKYRTLHNGAFMKIVLSIFVGAGGYCSMDLHTDRHVFTWLSDSLFFKQVFVLSYGTITQFQTHGTGHNISCQFHCCLILCSMILRNKITFLYKFNIVGSVQYNNIYDVNAYCIMCTFACMKKSLEVPLQANWSALWKSTVCRVSKDGWHTSQ